ncbi:Acetyltransferase, GNAT family [Lysobacter dokdonensis DS-58]|uniref:Acetyltransferase, GNAT family n=1 Tax=Lysobacter dokdonensis DS-58 TaxID=1300345 RepID=A0A0A2WJC3_9GAMM|nr:GNAT family N-acetyltransferase [Lysobacter dokdonensis]KGQ18822.1 Acetyltransferase, GNAT family [Lysobacter dokdonensis DS-58]
MIRRATFDDAQVLTDVAERAFVVAFGHLYPPADLAQFLHDAYSVEQHRKFLSDPKCAMWLVERDGQALGYALAGRPCTLPHAGVRPEDGELKRIYLMPEAQNGGVGSRLIQTAFDWLEKDGPTTLWIGVYSQNFGAQRFYERLGFENVGGYEFHVGSVRDPEFILRRTPAA